MSSSEVSTVVVHEWYESVGGSEAVVNRIRDMLPTADFNCLWVDPDAQGATGASESWLSGSPLRHKKALALPFMLQAWRSWRGDHEWAVISSHSFAHQYAESGNKRLRKLAYVHTPARYVWAPEVDPRGGSTAARALAAPLKAVDRRRARELQAIAVNSRYIQQRVANAWDRDSIVVYPPVRAADLSEKSRHIGHPVEYGAPRWAESGYLLAASRLVSYKRIDVAIETASDAGIPLVIAGDGPDRDRLQAAASQARVPVFFSGRINDDFLHSLFTHAAAFVFPAVEDFGIMPAEALACGTPIVVNQEGGAREICEGSPVGATFDLASRASRLQAVESVLAVGGEACRSHALRFDGREFDRQMRAWLQSEGVPIDAN